MGVRRNKHRVVRKRRSLNNLRLSNVVCPVCMDILIEPVTLPCNHDLCLQCFEKSVEINSLTCPMCRRRMGSWLRQAKDKRLVNETLWKCIQEKFRHEVEAKLNEDDDGVLDRHSAMIPPVTLSTEGAIREEFALELQRYREEIRRRQEKEEKASLELIKKLQEEENRKRLEATKLITEDEEIARKVQESVKQLSYLIVNLQSLRRSKRIQQRKRSEAKQKNNKKLNLEEDRQYFNQAVQLNDGSVHIAGRKQVTVRGVPVEASATSSVEPEENHNVLPNRSNQKATQGSTVSLNKKKKQSQKPRRKSISKNKPAASSSKTKKTPVVKLSDKVTEVPHIVIAQPSSTFHLSGDLPAVNTIRLLESNSNKDHTHTHHVIMPNSETVLNQLSDTNNVTNATEAHTATLRHQCVTGQHCDVGHSQCCENNVHTIPNCLVNAKQNQTMPQVSNINGNCSPARVPHNAKCTPAVLQTNQFQNKISRQLFPPKQKAYHPQPASCIPNPSIHSKGSIGSDHCSHAGEPSGSNPSTFHSQTKSDPVQQLLQCYKCYKCQKVDKVNQHLPNRGPADLTNLLFTRRFQQTNIVHHIVHHINPHIYNSLAGSAEHHCFQNQQSGNNIFSSGQRQGISALDTATSQVFNYNKHASQSTQQQLSNSRGQPQELTIFLPFYGRTPIEIEIE